MLATTTTTFPEGALPDVDGGRDREEGGPAVELVCAGLATSRKKAEFYAAADLVAALREVHTEADAVAILDSLDHEIATHRSHLGAYGYVFYVAEATGG